MKKIISSTLSTLALMTCTVTASADSMVWEVTKGDNRLFLAGTVHLLKPSDYPLPEEYQQTFAEADALVFEADSDALMSPEFGMKVAQKMMLPQGQTLSTVLEPDVYQQLKAFAEGRGLPIEPLAGFKPAFVALSLFMLELQRLGFSEGVETVYSNKAKAAGKTLMALETPDEQLNMMLAMAELEPNDFVRFNLADIDKMSEVMDEIAAAFKRGDDEELFELSAEPMLDYSKSLYKTLLVERNRNWLTDIETYLETPEVELVMVGALHLSGPDSVVAMLKDKGFAVKRY